MAGNVVLLAIIFSFWGCCAGFAARVFVALWACVWAALWALSCPLKDLIHLYYFE